MGQEDDGEYKHNHHHLHYARPHDKPKNRQTSEVYWFT